MLQNLAHVILNKSATKQRHYLLLDPNDGKTVTVCVMTASNPAALVCYTRGLFNSH